MRESPINVPIPEGPTQNRCLGGLGLLGLLEAWKVERRAGYKVEPDTEKATAVRVPPRIRRPPGSC